MANAAAFNKKMHVIFLSMGSDEPEQFQKSIKGYYDAIHVAGIKAI